MKLDPGSNYTIATGLSALSRVAATTETATVDHAGGDCVTFFLSCGTFAGTSLVATVQHSENDSDWTAEADTTAGNEVSGTLTEAGTLQIDVPNPRGRYSNLSIVADGTCVFSVVSILCPKRYVAPA